MVGVPNVLMGILGSTVTMGLALASGSQIGPQFQEVNQTTRAAMAMSSVRQTGQAVIMATTLDGGVEPGLDGTMSLIRRGLLNTTPRNPTSDQPAGVPVVTMGRDGTRFVAMPLVADDGTLCEAVVKQSTSSRILDHLDASAPTSGCARLDGKPVAFVRV